MLQHLLVYLLSSLCLCAQADSLRLVTGDDYAPFTGKALPAGGMLTQVVRAALKQSNIENSLDWRPWNRGYMKTLRGDYDATFPYVRTPQREEVFLYSEPLFIVEQHIFSRTGEVLEITDVTSMKGRRFCYPLGWQPPAVIQQLLDDGQLIRHSPTGLSECARLLLLGRDDFFISDRLLGETAIQLIGAPAEQFRRSAGAISRSPLHLIVPRNNPHGEAIIEQFNLGLAALRASGDYQRVLERNLQQREPATP
ncbi:substrate-binding periplasmic protein [Pseudomonas leptonychotis]|uniref:substrate-binding periplasmic protein n=1 Tax=Pseudomonas leptonychotis TaxID=2448482 RepID=UPI0039F138C8